MSHKVAVVSDRKPLCRPRQIVQVFHGADTACCVKYSYATKNYESPFLSSLGATLEYLTKAKPSAGPAYGPWLRSGKNALWAAGAAALSSRCGSATESRLFWSLSGPLVSNWHHLSPSWQQPSFLPALQAWLNPRPCATTQCIRCPADRQRQHQSCASTSRRSTIAST